MNISPIKRKWSTGFERVNAVNVVRIFCSAGLKSVESLESVEPEVAERFLTCGGIFACMH
jgi:hypothetical protein